jgi:hypothetical protein
MNEITASHHAGMRERARSISQRSTTSRPVSSGGSIFDKVEEYIKPNRPESVYGQRTGYTSFGGHDRSSFKGSVYVPEGPGSRWSRVGGSVRRTFSRHRDTERDERTGRNSWMTDGSGKRRSRVIPVSPALKKYNKAVRAGEYWP